MKSAHIGSSLIRIIIGTALGPLLVSFVWVIFLFLTGSSGNAVDDLLLVSAFWVGTIFVLFFVPSLLFALVIEYILHKYEIRGLKLALVSGGIGFLLGGIAVLTSPNLLNSLIAGSLGALLGALIASVMGWHYQRYLARIDLA